VSVQFISCRPGPATGVTVKLKSVPATGPPVLVRLTVENHLRLVPEGAELGVGMAVLFVYKSA
jgi:hypothetical protein